MGSTRPNPTHVGWVALGWTYVMGWVGLNFFLTHHGGLGQKILSTRFMHTLTWWITRSGIEEPNGA